jgi:tRNA(fMet)-specific endonuclease VapC
MAILVVDTDVVSFTFKGSPQARLYSYHLNGNELVISFQTVAELDRWALRNNWGPARKTQLEAYLRQFAVHQCDRALCLAWAEVTEGMRRKGRIISTADAWVAATALINNVPLVSHNRRHFEAVDGLILISEG